MNLRELLKRKSRDSRHARGLMSLARKSRAIRRRWYHDFRVEALEDRRLLAVSVAQVQDDASVAVEVNFLQDNAGTPGSLIADGVVDTGQTFFVELLVEDLRDDPAGVIGLAVDLAWPSERLNEVDGTFNPTDPASPLLTSAFPLFRGGTLDQNAGTIDELTGASLPAADLGTQLGQGQAERFGLLRFRAGALPGTSSISVVLGAGGIALADDAAVSDIEFQQQEIRIRSDEPLVSIMDAEPVIEGNPASFTVRLDRPLDFPVQVNYSTQDGTAIGGEDYEADSGSITIPAGEVEAPQPILISTIDDDIGELDETFRVSLISASGAVIDPFANEGEAIVFDNDAAVITIDDVERTEGNSGDTKFDFSVRLSRPVDAEVNVQVDTIDDSATVADNDYRPITGQILTFQPGGPLTQTVSVSVVGDLEFEPDESFIVRLSELQSADNSITIAEAEGRGTILNDDTGALRGAKFEDFNGNGQWDRSPTADEEPGVAEVTIFLDIDNDGELDVGEPSTQTREDDPSTDDIDETGYYAFQDLQPGTYVVREIAPDGMVQTFPGGPTNSHTVTVGPGETVQEILFGNQVAANSSISGYVYLDVHNNGVMDETDRRLPNVPVTLSGPVSMTVRTGEDGSYQFDHLPAGTYAVTETQPLAFDDGIDSQGIPILGTVENDRFVGLTIDSDTHLEGYNFGERGLRAELITIELFYASNLSLGTSEILQTLNVAGGSGWYRLEAEQSAILSAGLPGVEEPIIELYTDGWMPVAINAGEWLVNGLISGGEDYLLYLSTPSDEQTFPAAIRLTLDTSISFEPDQNGTYTNRSSPVDVTGDGYETPLDALVVINALNLSGAHLLLGPNVDAPYLDINHDDHVTPMDVLTAVNRLNEIAAQQAANQELPADAPTGTNARADTAASVRSSPPAVANGGSLRVVDNSGEPDDFAIEFGTRLSEWRPGAVDSPLVRSTLPDTFLYVEITNTGTGAETLAETRIYAPGVSIEALLSGDPSDDVVLQPGEMVKFAVTFSPEVPGPSDPVTQSYANSHGLVIVIDSPSSHEIPVRLVGASTFSADLSYDRRVDADDLAFLQNRYLSNENDTNWDPASDANGDGTVNLADLGPLNVQYGLDGTGPVLTADLVNDTARPDVTEDDGITTDATIHGSVTDAGGIAVFRGGFDDTPSTSYIDLSTDLQGDGTFQLDVDRLAGIYGSELPDGAHTLYLYAEDGDGNRFDTYDVSFVLDRSMSLLSVELDPQYDSPPLNDDQTSINPVTLTGLTEPWSLVELANTDATTSADADGLYRFEDVTLTEGSNVFNVQSTDLAGNTGEIGYTITLVQPNEVEFGDPDLAAAIRRQLMLPATAPITEAEMAKLTQLTADSNAIDNLSGIEYAGNLEALILRPSDYSVPGSLTDLTPLKSLPNLKSLSLIRAGVTATNFAALSPLPGVESLDLRYNDLSAIPSLTGWDNLASVQVYGNELTDTSAIKALLIDTDLIPQHPELAETIPHLAAALYYSPIEIYEYLYNNFEYQPYDGLMKGAQATLETRAGNAWDVSALLVELLGASGFAPEKTRYVAGRVDIPSELVTSWVGGHGSEEAVRILDAAHLNPETLPDGTVRCDHAWIEAELAMPGAGVMWVPMDASFKRRDVREGVPGLLDHVPFVESEYLAAVRSELPHEYYAGKLTEYLSEHQPDKSTADVGYLGPIIRQSFNALPETPPYEVAEVEGRFGSIPDNRKYRATVEVYVGSACGNLLISQDFAIPEISLDRLTLTYRQDPESDLDFYPELRRNGEVIPVDPPPPSVRFNNDMCILVQQDTPHGRSGQILVQQYNPGKPVAIGMHALQFSDRMIARETAELTAATSLDSNGVLANPLEVLQQSLYLGLVNYYHDNRRSISELGEYAHLIPVHGDVDVGFAFSDADFWDADPSTPNFIDHHWDLQFPAVPEDLIIDLKTVGDSRRLVGNENRETAIRRLVGFTGSAQEHAVWEKLFNSPSVSTIKLLQLASEDPDNCVVYDNELAVRPCQDVEYGVWKWGGRIEEQSDGSSRYIVTPKTKQQVDGGGTSDRPNAGVSGSDGDVTAGDPVRVNTGEFIRDETDVVLPAVGIPLAFSRHYRSLSEADAGFGPGWSHTYSDTIVDATETTAIGTGGGAWVYPFATADSTARTQVIYLQSEVGSAKTITGLALNVLSLPKGTLDSWTIRLKHTAMDFYAEESWEANDGSWTTVYAADQTFDATGWLQFDFDTPFFFNGRDNLMVDFSYRAESRENSSGLIASSIVPEYRALYRSDDDLGDPLNWSGSSPRSYDSRELPHVRFSSRDLTWLASEGKSYVFHGSAETGYETPPTLHGTMTETSTGYEYRDKFGMIRKFDQQGRLADLRDRKGNSITITRFSDGRIQSAFDTDVPSRKLTFDWMNDRITNVTAYAEGEQRGWEYAYTSGRLSQVTRPLDANTPQSVTRYSYYADDALAGGGMLRDIIAADDGTTTIDYYLNGRAFQVTDAEGRSEHLYYDLYRDRTEFVDARGNSTLYDYDENGYVTQMVHPDGARESYEYENQLMTKWTDAFGQSETYAYYDDERGNLKEIKDRAGIVTKFEYEPTYNQVSRTERPGGRVTTFTHGASGNLEWITDTLGNLTHMTYYDNGLLKSVSRPKGMLTPEPGDYTTTFTYNDAGQILTEATDLPSTWRYTYDAFGTLATATDPNNRTTTYDYDALNRLRETTDPLQHSQRMTYDTLGRLISTTDALEHTVEFSYDRVGNLIRVTQPDDTYTTTSFDPGNNAQRVSDELGHSTMFAYDPRNMPIQTIYADGSTDLTRYDGGRRVIATVDALGYATTYFYDEVDRLLGIADPLNNTTHYRYDGLVGNLESITDRRGAVTAYEYDLLDRVVLVQGEEGYLVDTDYDPNGNVVATTQYDVKGLATIPEDLDTLVGERKRTYRTEYDVLDRPTKQFDPLNYFTETIYDAASQVKRTIDKRGEPTVFEYDDAGRLDYRITPDGGKVDFEYDDADRLTDLTMPEGGLWQWEYDSRDRVIAEMDPLTRRAQYDYDAVDQVLSQSNPDGSWIDFRYDEVLQLLERTRSDGSFDRYQYDLNGNMVQADNEATTMTLTYDELNRRTTEYTTALEDDFESLVQYEYDQEGNLAKVTDPWNREISYAYDLAGRLNNLSDTDGATGTITFTGFGQRETITYANGRIDRFLYDARGGLSSITYEGPDGSSFINYAQRDETGAPTEIRENLNGISETLTITRDKMGRPEVVTATNNPDRSESFSYDLNGNLVNTGVYTGSQFDDADQLLSNSGATYEHDSQGNLTVTRYPDGSRLETIHDPSNRIKSIREYDPSGNETYEETFVYDGLGRRIGTADGNETVRRVFAFNNTIAAITEDSQSNIEIMTYLVGPGLDQVVAARVSDAVQYLHRDEIGSVRLVSGPDAGVITADSYSLFGRSLVTDGENETDIGFVGRNSDAHTSLVDMRARMYDPAIGRFSSEDPISSLVTGNSLFVYSDNQPLTQVDLTGLSPDRPGSFSWWDTLVGTGWEEAFQALGGATHGFAEEAFQGIIDATKGAIYGFGQLGYGLFVEAGGNPVVYVVQSAFSAVETAWNFAANIDKIYTGVATGVGQFWSEYRHLQQTGDVYAAADHLARPFGYVWGHIAAGAAVRPFMQPRTGPVGLADDIASKDAVNLVSPGHTKHILFGDATGGGHKFGISRLFNGKNKFPRNWSDQKILHAISEVATDPKSRWIQQTGRPGALYTKGGTHVKFKVEGIFDGVKIRAIVKGSDIITAFPIT